MTLIPSHVEVKRILWVLLQKGHLKNHIVEQHVQTFSPQCYSPPSTSCTLNKMWIYLCWFLACSSVLSSSSWVGAGESVCAPRKRKTACVTQHEKSNQIMFKIKYLRYKRHTLKHLLQNRRDEFLLSLWHLIHLCVFTPLFDKLNRLFSKVSWKIVFK